MIGFLGLLRDSEADGHAMAVGCPVVAGTPVAADTAGVSGIPTVHRKQPPVVARTSVTITFDPLLPVIGKDRVLKSHARTIAFCAPNY